MTRRQAGLWAGVVLGAVFLGCQTTTAPVAPDQIVSKGSPLSLVESMGPNGGKMTMGPYTLTIPPGALSSATAITMTQLTSGEWPVQMGPEGTQFAAPVTLAFDATSEPNATWMTVAWWNPSTSQWVDQVTEHDGNNVLTHPSHFSRFVIH